MPVPPSQAKPNKLLAMLVMVVFAAALFCGVLVVRFLVARSELAEARELTNPIPATVAAVSAGKLIYEHHCASCHGTAGDGKGERAPNLSSAPTDFTRAAKMARITDGELFWVTTKGHRPMPAFEKKLSDRERWQVVDYIREFAKSTLAK